MWMIKITILAKYNNGTEATLFVTDSMHGPYGLSDHSAKIFFDRSLAFKIAKKVKSSYALDYTDDGGDTSCARVEMIALSGANPEEIL